MMDVKKTADLLRRVADTLESTLTAGARRLICQEARAAADELERRKPGPGWTWKKTTDHDRTVWTGTHPRRPGAHARIVVHNLEPRKYYHGGFGYSSLDDAKNVIRDFYHTPRFHFRKKAST